MKQGVLTHGRVRLLLSKGHSCYRPRRTGERKRKSVRGCIVDANLSVLNLVIIRKGKELNTCDAPTLPWLRSYATVSDLVELLWRAQFGAWLSFLLAHQ